MDQPRKGWKSQDDFNRRKRKVLWCFQFLAYLHSITIPVALLVNGEIVAATREERFTETHPDFQSA